MTDRFPTLPRPDEVEDEDERVTLPGGLGWNTPRGRKGARTRKAGDERAKVGKGERRAVDTRRRRGRGSIAARGEEGGRKRLRVGERKSRGDSIIKAVAQIWSRRMSAVRGVMTRSLGEGESEAQGEEAEVKIKKKRSRTRWASLDDAFLHDCDQSMRSKAVKHL